MLFIFPFLQRHLPEGGGAVFRHLVWPVGFLEKMNIEKKLDCFFSLASDFSVS
jgi:hypothetical protein